MWLQLDDSLLNVHSNARPDDGCFTQPKYVAFLITLKCCVQADFKECHPRCVGELDSWEGSQNTTRILYKRCIF